MINTVMYIGLALMVLLLIISWIPWRSVFDRVWGNNPTKAKVYVEAGEQIILCQGRLFSDCGEGSIYRFKYFSEWQSVIVPNSYPYRYILGCRQIRVRAGDSVASPLGDMPKDATLKVGSSTLDAIFRAQIGKELAKTVFGKAFNYMMILAVVIGIIVLGYFLFKQFTASIPVQPASIEESAPVQEQPDILE